MPPVVLQHNAAQQRFVTMTTDANCHPSGSDGYVSEDVRKDLKERIKLKYQKLGRDIYPDVKPDIHYELTPEEQEKKDRRRKQNREAAQRCRVKKKGEESQIFQDHTEQKALHKELTSEIERLSMEVVKLQEQLRHHDCCLKMPTSVPQDAHLYSSATEARPSLQPKQGDRGTRGASAERNTGVPVFHPSPSLAPDSAGVDMSSVEASDAENCGWASSINASMQLGDDSEEPRPFYLMRSESTGFATPSQRDLSPAESGGPTYMDLFSSASPVPTSTPSVPTSSMSLENGMNLPSRTLESHLERSKVGTIPQQSQTKRMLVEETPQPNIPTIVTEFAAEEKWCGYGEEEDVSSSTTSVSQPILPPSHSTDTNTPMLPTMSQTPSMDLPSISDLQPPFDIKSYPSMEGILSHFAMETAAASPTHICVTSSNPVLPPLPQGIVSSGNVTEPRTVVSDQHPGFSVSTPAVPSPASLSDLWGISSNPSNNVGLSAKLQTDDSVWVQKSSPQVFLGANQTRTMPARPCPSDSRKFHADMLMNSDASREESRSPSTAPGTPRAVNLPRSSEQGGGRACESWRGEDLDQNGMLTHGFSPNSGRTNTFSNRARNLTSGGMSLETSPLTLGGVSRWGLGTTEQRPTATLVPSLPAETAVRIQHAMKAGQLEVTSEEEQRGVMNELPVECREVIDAWDRQGGRSGGFSQSGAGLHPR